MVAKTESTGPDVSPLANEIVSADRKVTAAKAVRDKEAKDLSKSKVVLVRPRTLNF